MSQRSREFVDAALAIIKPPAKQRDAIRAKLVDLVSELPHNAKVLRQYMAPRRERTKHLQRYLKHLRATRQARPDWEELDEHFLAALNQEIDQVQRECDKRYGKKPRDRIAEAVVNSAADFLSPERRTLTYGGDWHLLTALLYEVASGEANRDHVLRYCREMKDGKILRRAPPLSLTR